jgi:hypothetical protein
MGGFSLNPFFNTQSPKNCEAIVIKTQLFSPNAEIVSKLTNGDILDILLLKSSGPCVAFHEDGIAGTIVSKNLYQLIKCINTGKRFIAIVREVSSGNCAITIQSKM